MSLEFEKFMAMWNPWPERMEDTEYGVFGNKFADFNSALISAEALVAGGSVLAPYIDGYIHDIDIYIHASKADGFYQILKTKLGYGFIEDTKNYIAPAYDESFFRKNNILARFLLVSLDQHSAAVDQFYPNIDIMIIPDDITLLSVVTNFDLTFCEIWYDGKTVQASDPAGILAKTGKLKKDYVEKLLVYLNHFTIKRLEKYVKKGFTISYDLEPGYTFKKKTKNVLSPEEWVVYKLYNYIVFGTDRHAQHLVEDSFKIVCSYPLTRYTLAGLQDMLKKLQTNLTEDDINNNVYGSMDKRSYFIELFAKENDSRPSVTRRYYDYYNERYQKYIEDVLGISAEDIKDHVEYIAILSAKLKKDQEDEELYQRMLEEEKSKGVGYRLGHLAQDIDDFKFDEVSEDIDEKDMPNTTCVDTIGADDAKDIVEHLNEDDTFLFINKGSSPGSNFDILCFEKSYIERMLSNSTHWFYECQGDFLPPLESQDPNTTHLDKPMSGSDPNPYIKIPIDDKGTNGFIPLIQLEKLLESDNKIYYIYPYLGEDGVQKMITHSIGWKVAYGPPKNIGRAMVSANHCQYGSNILVYTLKLCRDQVRCIRSLADPRPTVISKRSRDWATLKEDEEDDEEDEEDEEDDYTAEIMAEHFRILEEEEDEEDEEDQEDEEDE